MNETNKSKENLIENEMTQGWRKEYARHSKAARRGWARRYTKTISYKRKKRYASKSLLEQIFG